MRLENKDIRPFKRSRLDASAQLCYGPLPFRGWNCERPCGIWEDRVMRGFYFAAYMCGSSITEST